MNDRFDIDEERDLLIKAQQGDLFARRKLHRIYKPLVDSIVYNNFSNTPQPVPAIKAEAEKLLDVYMDKWDPNFLSKPSTFLHSSISNKLQRYINEHQPVRVPEKYAWKTTRYKDSVSELTNSLNRLPTDSEVHTHMQKKFPDLNVSLKDINRLKREVRTLTLASSVLGREDDGSNLTVGDVTFVTEADPLESYTRQLKVQNLTNKINILPEPHRIIVLYHLGLNGHPKLSLRDISVKLGMNKYRVQVYLNEAKEMLKVDDLF